MTATIEASTGTPPRFRFGPRDTRGLLLGLRPAQLGLLIGGVGILVIGFATGGAAVLLALPIAVAAVVTAFARLGGYGADHYLLLLTRAAVMRLSGRDRQHVDVAALTSQPGRLGVPLDGVELRAVAIDGGGSIGVLHDHAYGTRVAVIAVAGGGLPLADADVQAQQVGGWGRVLTAIGRDGSPLTRVQWLTHTGTTSTSFAAPTTDQANGATVLASDSYRALLAAARHDQVTHRTYLAVACKQRASRGGEDVLVRELARICDLLTAADLDVIGVLPPRAVGRLLRRALDPTSTHVDADVDAAPSAGAIAAMGTETSWGAYRIDGVWHVTCWIAEWPRTDVAPDFLASLIVGADVELTVAVTGQPMSTTAALRRLRAARTSAHADGRLRARLRQAGSARDDVEASEVERRDSELAAGHVVYSFAGFLTVTATSRDALDDGCVIVEHAATRSGLVLRRMFGQQDRAFTHTLPLARPLR